MPKQLVYIDPQTGERHYNDGSLERPDGSAYNPPTGPEHSALGGGTAGMTADYKYNKMSGNRDQRRTGVYGSGGQVDPNTPPVGPYGSGDRSPEDRARTSAQVAQSNKEANEKYRDQHISWARNQGYGDTITRTSTGQTTGYYKRNGKLYVFIDGESADADAVDFTQDNNGNWAFIKKDSNISKASEIWDTKTKEGGEWNHLKHLSSGTPFSPEQSSPFSAGAQRGSAVGAQAGTSAENSIRNSVGNNLPPALGPAPATNTVTPTLPQIPETVVTGSPDSNGVIETGDPQYPKMSASLSIPISEFGIEDGTEHLQKLYDKQRELMEQGQNSQNSAAARAIRQRAMELNDHISKLKKSAALKTPEQLEADGERPLPPIKPPQYVGPLETDWEQGMHSFDKDGSGGLNQEELRAWRRWKQVGQGKRPDHRGNIVGEGHPNSTKHGSSTHRTPDHLMPGYSMRGGRDTTGTQHQDTGGINPNAPRFLGDGTMGPSPYVGQAGHSSAPPASGQDMMQQFPPGMPNPTPDTRLETNYGVDPNAGRLAPSLVEQAGMTDSVTAPPGEAPVGEMSGKTAQEKAEILLKEIRRSDTPVNYQDLIENPNVPVDVKEILVEMAIMDADGDGKVGVLERMRAARNRRDNPTAAMSQATTPGAAPMTGMMGAIQQNRRRRRQ